VTRQVVDTERRLALEEKQNRNLEESLSAQIQARLTAEEAVRSLSEELKASQQSELERTQRIEEQIREEVASQTGDPAHNAIMDADSGLYSEQYFRAAVEARVAAARRHLRPVAVVLMQVQDTAGDAKTAADPQRVADYLLATLRDSDTACRTSRGLYALVLEDTPENGAVWTVERIRRRLTEDNESYMIQAGVACYPAHAFEVRDLVGKASEALEVATEWHQDRIEVAISD
jgi:diguanylate cyclase (GGDEF)-like protein